MAIILDGKKLRDKILNNLQKKVEKFEVKPTLSVILVGENPASKIYVTNKQKMAEKEAPMHEECVGASVYTVRANVAGKATNSRPF